MCELFAMSARFPATVSLSFGEFSTHGGGTGPHADGWGIAYYEGHDVRLLREPGPAVHSSCAACMARRTGTPSALVLSHIRKATVGGVALQNTQPFTRELGGRVHVFAHNGDLPGVDSPRPLQRGRFMPVGETDSERAFCSLLTRLEPLWAAVGQPPPIEQRRQVIEGFAADIRALGPANFIYADGDALFAHGHRRRPKDSNIPVPPGLYTLTRRCSHPYRDFSTTGLSIGSERGNEQCDSEQQVVLFASVPLSDESWQPLGDGELRVVQFGSLL